MPEPSPYARATARRRKAQVRDGLLALAALALAIAWGLYRRHDAAPAAPLPTPPAAAAQSFPEAPAQGGQRP